MSILSLSLGLVFCFLINATALKGQDYEVGVSYFDDNEYVEYIPGNLPLILSAPHGGEKKPTDIADRSCTGCVYVNDAFTQELLREVSRSITEYSGCQPYRIINRLHRSKLDANRAIIEAADGNPLAESAWHFYHDHILVAQNQVEESLGAGLFIDLHGHGHDIQRLELGYLISATELREDDPVLSLLAEESSIKNLVTNHPTQSPFSELIRGASSLGSIVANKGYDSVPSDSDPYPESGESYFRGGYNTVLYGSRDGGAIDAIQIECNQDVRFQTATRKRFADSLALSILEYLELHYSSGAIACEVVSLEKIEQADFHFYPNPASNSLQLEYGRAPYSVSIIDLYGQERYRSVYSDSHVRLDLLDLEPGIYTLLVQEKDAFLSKRLSIIR